jgi:erythromycin esterase-like protein
MCQVTCAERVQVEWVLIGEGSHGTHEYYQLRADVTKLLIEKRGFNAVATEAGEFNTQMKLAYILTRTWSVTRPAPRGLHTSHLSRACLTLFHPAVCAK